jgi:DNA-binding transcriptional regulator YhcF (GntR family)
VLNIALITTDFHKNTFRAHAGKMNGREILTCAMWRGQEKPEEKEPIKLFLCMALSCGRRRCFEWKIMAYGIQLVRGRVLRFIDSHPPGTQLPVDRVLAEHCGVSVMTVRRALTTLAAEGRVERVKGAGSFIPRKNPLEKPVIPGPTPVYRHIAECLDRDIRQAVIRKGASLPARKELALRFNCSVDTVGAAMDELLSKGVARRSGRRIIAGQFRRPLTPAARVYIIAPSAAAYAHLREASEGAAVIAAMERELNAAGVRVGFLSMHELKSMCRGGDERVSRAAGFVFCGSMDGMLSESEFRSVAGFIKGILMKHAGAQVRAVCITRQSIIRIKRTLFFSFSHLVTIRMRTVARACGGWQYGRIRIVCTDSPADQGPGRLFFDMLRLRTELRHFAPHADVDIAILTAGSAGRRPLTARMRGKLTHHLKPEEYLPRLSKYRRVTDADATEGVFEAGDFSAALAHDGTSTLYCIRSAGAALDILGQLRDRGDSIPRHAAVLSLEESGQTAAAGITTALLDEYRAGYLLARALLRDMPVALSHRGFIDPPGCLLLRETTP